MCATHFTSFHRFTHVSPFLWPFPPPRQVKNKRDLANFSARKEDAPRLGNFLELRNLLVGVYLVTCTPGPGNWSISTLELAGIRALQPPVRLSLGLQICDVTRSGALAVFHDKVP